MTTQNKRGSERVQPFTVAQAAATHRSPRGLGERGEVRVR